MEKNNKLVSIIVACRYRPDLTQVCIDSILKYTNDDKEVKCELILVQEGDDKEMEELLKSYSEAYRNIFYIQNKVPKGYSGALNTGMDIANGDYYCFMNNDTVATPKWMKEMMLAFDNRENTGVVSPTFWGMGSRQSVDWNKEGLDYDYVHDIFNLVGVCYLIPKEVMKKIGRWDESFGHGGEDFDLMIRIDNAGYYLVIARKSFIYHYGGASTRIVFDNDLVKVRKNQMDRIEQLVNKHHLSREMIMEKYKIPQGEKIL